MFESLKFIDLHKVKALFFKLSPKAPTIAHSTNCPFKCLLTRRLVQTSGEVLIRVLRLACCGGKKVGRREACCGGTIISTGPNVRIRCCNGQPTDARSLTDREYGGDEDACIGANASVSSDTGLVLGALLQGFRLSFWPSGLDCLGDYSPRLGFCKRNL